MKEVEIIELDLENVEIDENDFKHQDVIEDGLGEEDK